MSSMKELAAITALNNMLGSKYFDITCIDAVGDLMEINAKNHEDYRTLRALHCIHYDKMPKELRDEIPLMVQRVLGVGPTFRFTTLQPHTIDVSPPQPEKKPLLGWFK